MSKKLIMFSLLFISVFFIVKAFAHSGRTNWQGCHHNYKANPYGEHYQWDWDYHCH